MVGEDKRMEGAKETSVSDFHILLKFADDAGEEDYVWARRFWRKKKISNEKLKKDMSIFSSPCQQKKWLILVMVVHLVVNNAMVGLSDNKWENENYLYSY